MFYVLGLVIANPMFWIAGLISLFVGQLLLYLIVATIRLNSDYGTYALVFLFLSSLAGIVLLIIGLTLPLMALWVGGLVFMIPIVLAGLFLLSLVLR